MKNLLLLSLTLTNALMSGMDKKQTEFRDKDQLSACPQEKQDTKILAQQFLHNVTLDAFRDSGTIDEQTFGHQIGTAEIPAIIRQINTLRPGILYGSTTEIISKRKAASFKAPGDWLMEDLGNGTCKVWYNGWRIETSNTGPQCNISQALLCILAHREHNRGIPLNLYNHRQLLPIWNQLPQGTKKLPDPRI
jgi:hypothetical protein